MKFLRWGSHEINGTMWYYWWIWIDYLWNEKLINILEKNCFISASYIYVYTLVIWLSAPVRYCYFIKDYCAKSGRSCQWQSFDCPQADDFFLGSVQFSLVFKKVMCACKLCVMFVISGWMHLIISKNHLINRCLLLLPLY